MSAPRNAQWFFTRAEDDLQSARDLYARQGTPPVPEQVLELLHAAMEKALKAAMISRNRWNGYDKRWFTHDLDLLIRELTNNGFPAPADLYRDLQAATYVPRTDATTCKMHTEAGYADNLDWSQISLPNLFVLAERTLEHVKRDCGFS